MAKSLFRCCFVLGLTIWAVNAASDQPWKRGDANAWTSHDAEQILTDSPWAQIAAAKFELANEGPPPAPAIDVPQAGMPSPKNAATDGRWDGGVGRVNRKGTPTLNVLVRWDSALPIRQAFRRGADAPEPYALERIRKDYILTVVGMIPAGRYGNATLDMRSGDATEQGNNPEPMLENLMRYASLDPRGKNPIHPDNATLDNQTGAVHLFFPRNAPLTVKDKEVTFQVRFGSLSVSKKFKLKDMLYKGELAL